MNDLKIELIEQKDVPAVVTFLNGNLFKVRELSLDVSSFRGSIISFFHIAKDLIKYLQLC